MTGSFESELRSRVKGDVATDAATRGLYATDASIYQITPVAVCAPQDDDDVRAAIETAAKHGVTILPRGGGTSLAGQTVGESLVLDFSKYMNQILELNVEERWVRVQPGVVRDELNDVLTEHRLQFAPDPATANRANVGGMIGNNSSGTRSIVYGKTIDHVLDMRVVLARGEVVEFKAMTPEEYEAACALQSDSGRIYRGVRRIVEENREEIDARFPKVMRRVGGYSLDEFPAGQAWNLSKLMTGSEGTLATMLDARINLEPLPEATAVTVIHFSDLLEAIRAVEPIVAHGPSAVEILDRTVIGLARSNLSTAPLCHFLEGDPAAVLIVELFGEDEAGVRAKAEEVIDDIRERGMGYAFPVFTDAPRQADVWAVRKNGLGLMLGVKGDRKPTPFIEDAAVPIAVLPEYIDQVLAFCKERNVPVAMYAHASVGVIHVRPMLDLRTEEDVENLTVIADYALGLVMKYEGSWSGEHGDGLVRSPHMETFFGKQVYAAFKEVKALFDPDNLMNPGKIVDAPPMDTNLRYGTQYEIDDIAPMFHYRDDGSFGAAVEMCTGVGACRKTLGGTMCPSYMATRDERHTTRGRANALRLAMTGQLGADGLASRELFDVLDLCLSCKACKSECPSNVDMAKLKSEVLQAYHDEHGTRLRDRMLVNAPRMAERLAGPLAPLVNAIQGSSLGRRILESAVGIDRRRRLPGYAGLSLTRWFDRRASGAEGAAGTVVLYDDTFVNYFEPQVGRASVALLEGCGYKVILARAGCCQRPRLSHGFLRDAKRDGTRTLQALDAYISAGLPIVVTEPSCAAALTDDLPDLVDDAGLAERVRSNVMMIDVFLDRELEAGKIDPRFEAASTDVLVHGHCNQKALYGTAGMNRILARAGMTVEEVDSGCCGMAGSFGYEKEHYDISQVIGERRLFPAVRNLSADAGLVACGFSCRHQIADATGRQASHWVQLLRTV